MLLAVKLTDDVDQHLAEQCALLDGAWRHLAARLAAHTGGQGTVRVEVGRDGRAEVRVAPLDRLEEPPSLVALRELTGRMLPHVDLPELLLEVHARTGFLGEFTHASGGEARMDDLEISMAGVLAYQHWINIRHPERWVRRVASRMLVRRLARVEEVPVDRLPDDTLQLQRQIDMAASEQQHDVLRLLAVLPLRQRQVMAWTFDGYSPSEIADELQVTPSTVRTLLHRARETLASHLGSGEES